MSIKAMSYCWEHSLQSGSKLLMLLAIADFADDDGVAYPGVTRLASKTRMTERNAKRTIHALEESGELTVSYNDGVSTAHGVTNRYLLTAYRQVIGAQFTRTVTPKPHGVTPMTPHGVTPMTPKPSVEPSVEPSEKEKSISAIADDPDAPISAEQKAHAAEIITNVVKGWDGNSGSHWKTDAEIRAEVEAALLKYPNQRKAFGS